MGLRRWDSWQNMILGVSVRVFQKRLAFEWVDWVETYPHQCAWVLSNLFSWAETHFPCPWKSELVLRLLYLYWIPGFLTDRWEVVGLTCFYNWQCYETSFLLHLYLWYQHFNGCEISTVFKNLYTSFLPLNLNSWYSQDWDLQPC